MYITPIQFGRAIMPGREINQGQHISGTDTCITPRVEDSDIQLSLSSSEPEYTNRPFLSVTCR